VIDTVRGFRSIPAVPIWFALLLLALASCDMVEPQEDSIVLMNRGDLPMAVFVMELEESYLIDPSPEFEVEEEDERVLAPGESRRVSPEDIGGDYRRGQDIATFLYDVEGETAVFRELRTFRHMELVRRGFIVLLP